MLKKSVSLTLRHQPMLSLRRREGWRYVRINGGASSGILRLANGDTPPENLLPSDIVVFKDTPATLPPVAGIIVADPLSPAAHSMILAAAAGIPVLQAIGADVQYRPLEGCSVVFDSDSQVPVRLAIPATSNDGRHRDLRGMPLKALSDLGRREIAPLDHQRRSDSAAYGAKSANLGELSFAVKSIKVPRGIAIPFAHYREFIQKRGLEPVILKTLESIDAVRDSKYTTLRLKELRAVIENEAFPAELAAEILAKSHVYFSSGTALFARSSTNAEDLPGFPGAGLYTTVANVRQDAEVLRAVKTVWASVWNYNAFQMRESLGVKHLEIFPAVLLQEGVDADRAGVALTANPLALEDSAEVVFIAAKRGLGMRVVEGHETPEQILYDVKAGTWSFISRSQDGSALRFAAKGGVESYAAPIGQAVLSDDGIRAIAAAAAAAKRAFGGVPQDLEWVLKNGELYIVQARPYIRAKREKSASGGRGRAPEATAGTLTTLLRSAPKDDQDLNLKLKDYFLCDAFRQSNPGRCGALDGF
ncbi:MAG: hypothetical protein HYZ74_02570, partial [Elusimicrobia bacterium]|nr:hypothetical protein [Elusimicrobiota bacterium]